MSNKHYSFKNICCLISLFSLFLSLSSSATETPLTLEEAWAKQATQSAEKVFIQPKVTQEEMMLGLLEVLKKLTDKTEMTPKNIEQWFGKPFRTYSDEPQKYYISGNATQDWDIFLIFDDYYRNRSPRISFTLIKLDKSSTKRPPLTEVCTVDVDTFDRAIKKLGYEKISEINRYSYISHKYRRGNISVDMRDVREGGEKNSKLCIQHVYIRTLSEKEILL